jgi:hypothetical protein
VEFLFEIWPFEDRHALLISSFGTLRAQFSRGSVRWRCGCIPLYSLFGISAQAIAGQAAEVIPLWAKLAGAVILLGLSVKSVYDKIHSRLSR